MAYQAAMYDVIVPGATHLFEECGKLEMVAQLAAHLLVLHMAANAVHTA